MRWKAFCFASLFLGVVCSGLLFVGNGGYANALDLQRELQRELQRSASGGYETQFIRGQDPIWHPVNQGINYFLGILGVVAVIMVLYAGFLWMTAGGKEDQIGKAKKILKQAIIGIIIISFAYGIVGFVFKMLPQAPEPAGVGGDGLTAPQAIDPNQVPH